MKVAFVINARNKASLVGRAVKGALAQTYPCDIILSDQNSTDGTYEAMMNALVAERVIFWEGNTKVAYSEYDHKEPKHLIKLLRCPVEGSYGMVACNKHMKWLIDKTDAEWIFQCSADDYSLPDRVSVCMQAVEKNACDAIGCTMYFEKPDGTREPSVYTAENMYVSGWFGIRNLAYGSNIWGYRRDFLLKVGVEVPCTLDVYLGYLASVGRGCYIVANPQHVHYMAEDLDNMGFQGKMRAAEKSGDKETIARINELNRFQLFELYLTTKLAQQKHYPMAHQQDQNELINMMLTQGIGWYESRAYLHAHKITPGVMP